MTLSSKEFNPKVLDYLTSFKHLAHLCTAYLVKPTRKGIIKILVIPKISMKNIASRQPSRFVSQATTEKQTAEQWGHRTFYAFSSNNICCFSSSVCAKMKVAGLCSERGITGADSRSAFSISYQLRGRSFLSQASADSETGEGFILFFTLLIKSEGKLVEVCFGKACPDGQSTSI